MKYLEYCWIIKDAIGDGEGITFRVQIKYKINESAVTPIVSLLCNLSYLYLCLPMYPYPCSFNKIN